MRQEAGPVTDHVADIASAGAEQASGIEQVNRAVQQMDHVVQSSSAQTEEMSATAEELTSQARQLRDLVDRFKLSSAGASKIAHDGEQPLSDSAARTVPEAQAVPKRDRRSRTRVEAAPAAPRPARSVKPRAGRRAVADVGSFESF